MSKNKAGKDEDDMPVTRRELYDLLMAMSSYMRPPHQYDNSTRVVGDAIESGMWMTTIFDNLKKDAYDG